MKLTNLALVDTDSSINMLFNLDESISEPLNDRFEEAGYDSTNFFILLGLVFYLLMFFIIWNILILLMQKCTRNMNNCLTKRLRKKRRVRKTILIFLLESCSELSISALICIRSISMDKFNSFSEGLSTLCACFTMIFLVVLPFYLMKFMKRHHHETLSGHLKISKRPAKDLFPDLRG